MNFYQDTGVLIMGTWFRRVSEKFLNEISVIYKELGIPFEPSWFPVFYLLKDKPSISIIEMANTLDISHSAVSQMVSNLKKKGHVKIVADKKDARKKNVALTSGGKTVLDLILPVWNSLEQVMPGLWDKPTQAKHFIQQLSQLEDKLNRSELSQKVLEIIPEQDFKVKRILSPKHHQAWQVFLSESESHFDTIPFKSNIWGIFIKEELLGAIALIRAKNSIEVILEQIYIKPDYRRKGLALTLLKQALREIEFKNDTDCLLLKNGDLTLLNMLLKAGITFKMFAT